MYVYRSQVALVVKNTSANAGDTRTWDQCLGREDPLEEGLTTHSVFLPGQSLWTEEPGRLQSMGPQRVGHDGSNTTHMHM